MADAEAILRSARSVLVVDWPTRDVPDELAAAGLDVFIKNGPGPEDFAPRRPERVDLVYAYRPVAELPELAAAARELGASSLWHGVPASEAEAAEARQAVEAEGLRYVGDADIAATARSLRA